MSAEPTRAVVKGLEARGAEIKFVGGCVRDAFAQRPITDIDIATPDLPETVIELLQLANIKVVPTGLKHGTVTAIVKNFRFEITTLRRDIETNGRHATVAFTEDWYSDAKRRDFTINAIYTSPSGAVYDPFGGILDLGYGHVRFIGLARDRISEDYLRILRFFRFHGQFGRGPLDREAKAACRANAEKLQDLSHERIRNEFFKILLVPNPADICAQMQDAQVLQQILPQTNNIKRLRILNEIETKFINIDKVKPDPIRHLAALLDINKTEVKDVAERLMLSKIQRRRISYILSPKENFHVDISEEVVQQAIRNLGSDQVMDLALLSWANALFECTQSPNRLTKAYTRILMQCVEWTPPKFPLSGADVLAVGVQPGPSIGKIISRVETWWANTGYRADRQDCLKQLSRAIIEIRKDES